MDTRARGPQRRRSLKRLLLGRPIATERLEHERLGKPTALAVFASDNLSSVAYATEEILRVLVPVVGVVAFTLVFRISLAIVAVEAILIFSYRQTIKAYPSAGGAYIVTKDNFGVLPAQVAGVSLLVDYVLTVAVSVAAGTQALSSVVPAAHALRVPIALGFVALLAYGNLLGVRESGRIFGVPTYLFIVSLFVTIGVGIARVLTGGLAPMPVPTSGVGEVPAMAGAVSLFLVLRAFASGGAAVTGVEAISNGVPAFRRPEWRNARTTLTWMGVILGPAFLGVSFLAQHLRVVPVADESKSVLAQIAQAVYGDSALGHAMFILLQGTTMLILVLAANTSFADFPRLASFQAGDAFLPRQFTKRGHRLVYSNGIIGLAAVSAVVLVAFGASVTNLIPLYAIGVFTSFTLSQAGMAKRHLRLREPGWRHGLLINGVGAVATLIVDVVIAVVKFKDGAWMIMVAVPVLVSLLVRVNRTYEREDRELLDGLSRMEREPRRRGVAIIPVDAVDNKTLHAVQYALTIGARELHAVHMADEAEESRELAVAWQRWLPRMPLERVELEGRDPEEALADYVGKLTAPDAEVTVIAPGPARMGSGERLRRGRSWSKLADALRRIPGANLAIVRDHGGPGHVKEGRVSVSPRARHVVLIMVGQLDRSVLAALAYARAVDAFSVEALHVAVDRSAGQRLLAQWAEHGDELRIPFTVTDCPDRNIGREVRHAVEELAGPDTEVTVVVPRRHYRGLAQRLLHDRTSREIARALRNEAHVEVVMVPYHFGARSTRRMPAEASR